MTILKLIPAQKDYLWGGTRLKDLYNKKSDFDIVAETWELSAHKDGTATIANGEFKDKFFTEFLEKNGKTVIGKNYDRDRFPILNKFIDAKNPLSIQVHPKDEYALKYENDYGKTEMWYVIDADDDSYLYYGFNRNITKDEYRTSINDGTLLEKLNKVSVKKGDVFFIEAGTVHAIGPGILIYEVQQNSNVTYRVYDYKRKDKNGNERELHIDKAIEVSNLSPNPKYEFNSINPVNEHIIRLGKSDYFDVFKGTVESEEEYKISDNSFQAITFIEGDGSITLGKETINYKKGETFFLPAQNGTYKIKGNGEFVLSKLPE